MRVAIYARVSKDDTSSSGKMQNPENQLIDLRKFCDAMHYTIVEEFVDKVSGGDSNRPAFIEMRKRVRQRRFDMVLVWSLDRFSREGIANTLSYIKELKTYGVHLKSLQESYMDTSKEGIAELILSLLSWVAAEERKKISKRTNAGLRRARLQKKILGRHPRDCGCGLRGHKGNVLPLFEKQIHLGWKYPDGRVVRKPQQNPSG